MTDKDTLTEMFNRAGVIWEGDKEGLIVEADKGEHNLGYHGFVAAFSFAEDGSLESVGAWE